MTHKIITLIILFIITGFYHNISAQPECYSLASNRYYNDISLFQEILNKGDIQKIIEKRGLIKKIYEFDPHQKSITITEKYFHIKASIDKMWFNDSLIEKNTLKWLRRGKTESEADYYYNQFGDTLFTYNILDSDSILKCKTFFDNISGAYIQYLYVLGPHGGYNEFYTIKSYFDKNKNKIKETLRDTTHSNNGFLSFEGIYDDHGNIIFEKCYTSYHNQTSIAVTVDYEYKFNKQGDWIRKYYHISDIDEEFTIKRRIKYF